MPLQTRNSKLSEQFGYDYACRLFGKEVIELLPKLETGKNKGKPKGYLIWRTALTAGYVRECQGPCKAGGLVDAWLGLGAGTPRNEAMYGQWFGRVQPIAGSRSILGEENRTAYKACLDKAEQERQDDLAELRASFEQNKK